jgi:hypothetical protein
VGVTVLALVARGTWRRACRRLVGQGGCGASSGRGIGHGSHNAWFATFWRKIDRPTDLLEGLAAKAMRYAASLRARGPGARGLAMTGPPGPPRMIGGYVADVAYASGRVA